MSDCFVKISMGEGTVFSLNTDGKYVLTTLPCNTTNHDRKPLSRENSCLLQCYSNGYINKISLLELELLRKNYTYSHGIFTGASLLHCGICGENDFVIVLFEIANTKYISIKEVSALASHSMLGLKGYPIIKTKFDFICHWYVLSNEQSIKVTNIISLCSRNEYISLDNTDCQKELLWLNDNIISPNEDASQSERTSTFQIHESPISDCDFSILIEKDHEDDLRKRFTDYLKNGRNIPIGQRCVNDVLALCNNKDDFWRVIKCLLECNVNIYRSPIVNYIKCNPDRLYTPDYESLESIIRLLFSINDKIEKNLEFLYPFRELLTKEDLSAIKNASFSLSKPEHFQILGEILKFTPQNLINYCLDNDSEASYYCIYEVLNKCYKDEGINSVRMLVDSIYPKLDNSDIKVKLIKNLINNVFKLSNNYITNDIINIKSRGFAEYLKICNSYKGKKKHKDSLDKITSLVGKKLMVNYIKTYQNHYLMSYSGIRVLLPKCMTKDSLSDGCTANVVIAMADKSHHTLFATQIVPVDYKKIMQTPLLNDGDIIDVTFDIFGSPIAHNCLKKIKISLDTIPKSVDYKARYQARVIRQTSDKYHYLVKLMSNKPN